LSLSEPPSGDAATEPKVFLDYTQAELDRAYDQLAYAPDRDAILARQQRYSERARERFRPEIVRYGDGPLEDMEVFRAGADTPVHVYIHGGQWSREGNATSGYPALTLVPAGAAYVNLNFPAIPRVRIPDMVASLRKAIAWLHANAARIGGDPARLHLSGSSSGGHLAAVLLTTDWTQHGLPADVIKSGLCISGLYEMTPVMRSKRRGFVQLSDDEVDALSPIRHLARVRCPVTVAIGGRETPEFRRQAHEFAAALGRRQAAVELIDLPPFNHFELPETMIDPAAPLSRAALRQLGLTA
jgi:arylformamidase